MATWGAIRVSRVLHHPGEMVSRAHGNKVIVSSGEHADVPAHQYLQESKVAAFTLLERMCQRVTAMAS